MGDRARVGSITHGWSVFDAAWRSAYAPSRLINTPITAPARVQ